MTAVDRRSFLRAVGALPGAAVVGCVGQSADQRLDDEVLRVVAEVVLPTELGSGGLDRVLGEFRGWLAAYRPAAEVLHGYGTGELEFQPEHPAPRWASQLRALDAEADARHGSSFQALNAEQRLALLERQLRRDRFSALPVPQDARHIAVGLLAFFYQLPEATDLCYGVRIDPFGCRPLQTVSEPPPARP